MKYLKERKEFLSEGKDFKEVKNTIIDREIKIAKDENFPDLVKRTKSLEKLRLESDPKKFITKYKKITGATNWDLPKELEPFN